MATAVVQVTTVESKSLVRRMLRMSRKPSHQWWGLSGGTRILHLDKGGVSAIALGSVRGRAGGRRTGGGPSVELVVSTLIEVKPEAASQEAIVASQVAVAIGSSGRSRSPLISRWSQNRLRFAGWLWRCGSLNEPSTIWWCSYMSIHLSSSLAVALLHSVVKLLAAG